MFNSIVLYVKIIITMLISLVSVPMILHALGASDYGLYNLVAGVISMLAFLNSSMAISTQRYISVAVGEGKVEKINTIYNSALIMHLAIGIIIVVLFEACYFLLFNGFLNIEPDRVGAAKIVYQFVVISTFLGIISVPYGAVMNAKEDMLPFSILSIIESLLRLGLAFYLGRCPFDRLVFYGGGMALIAFMSRIAFRFYVRVKYKEYEIDFRKYYDKDYIKNMIGFMGWNTFGSVAMICRNQGIAIIFNLFYNAVANAAYGIANQINSVLWYFSATFQKSLNPQLMKSEGMHNRPRLIRISLISSKYSVWVTGLFAIPLIIEMPYILDLWLKAKDVPAFTLQLSRLVLVLSIIYQCSVGLMSSIQAIGRIRNYQILMSLLILLNLPICFFVLKVGCPLYYCIVVFILIEIVSLVVRLFMAHRLVGIGIIVFLRDVVLSNLLCIFSGTIFAILIHILMDESIIRLGLVTFTYIIGYITIAWFFVFDYELKNNILLFLNKIFHRQQRHNL